MRRPLLLVLVILLAPASAFAGDAGTDAPETGDTAPADGGVDADAEPNPYPNFPNSDSYNGCSCTSAGKRDRSGAGVLPLVLTSFVLAFRRRR
jgi:uncharacterized protein (TIGR03382 family)